jgi:simple sugar transport system ATP-binding protein
VLRLGPEAAGRPVLAGQRRRMENAKGLLQHGKILILDEPTSVLTPHEAAELFTMLHHLRGIIFISHKLDGPVFRLAFADCSIP